MKYRTPVARAAGLVFTIACGANAEPAPVEPPSSTDQSGDDPRPVEVVVQGPRLRRDALELSVDAKQARQIPGTQGDAIKVVENLPGLARPSFGSGQLIVWGSPPSDTRIYVDGVEIPRLFHGSALRSTINGDLIRDVALTPGAYGADYGRGLGGVVRVETRDLPSSGVHGNVAADVLDGSAMVSATPSRNLRLAAAGRYGWLDRVLTAASSTDLGDYVAIPRYEDYQAKAQLALRDRESLELALLGSGDDLRRSIPDADPARAGQADTSDRFDRLYLRYRREIEDGRRIEVTPWLGRDSSRTDQHFGANPARLDERTWRWGLRASQRSPLLTGVNLTVGVDVSGASSELSRQGSLSIPSREGDISVFGRPPGDDSNADNWHVNVADVAPHATLNLRVGQLAINAGLRADVYLIETSRQTPRVGQTPSIGLSQLQGTLGPRLGARWQLVPRLAVIAGAGIYSQPPAPVDLSAVFGTPSLGLQTAYHATLGEAVELATTLSLETVGFVKWLDHLAVRDPSPTPKLAGVLLENGIGRSYGLQMLLRQQPWRGFFGWVAYTVSRSERRDAPESAWRLFDDDQSQVLTVVGSKAVGWWTLGMRFRYARGLPRTPVIGAFYDTKDDTFQPMFGPQNGIRLPNFWQLDVRIDRRFALADDTRLVVYVEVLNVTNRNNGEEYAYSVDYKRRDLIKGLPIIAAFGARVEF